MLVRLRVTSQTASGFQAKALRCTGGISLHAVKMVILRENNKILLIPPPTHTHLPCTILHRPAPRLNWQPWPSEAIAHLKQRKQHTEGHGVRQEPRQQPLQMQPCRAPLLVREVLAWTVGGYMTLLCTLTKLVKSFRSTITLLRKC